MRGVYKIRGFYSDFKKERYLQPRDYQVNITIDNLGATLSIADIEEDKQYTIPIDWLIREIKKGGR